MASRIEDYALIGDCETAALVAADGSIDWLCWPRFDSDACFAALLGTPENGRWQIAPAHGAPAASRRYRGDTLILETRFESDEGSALLIDFMPPRGDNSDLVRIVVGERGTVRFRSELVVRYGYGRVVPWMRPLSDTSHQVVAGPDMVVLTTPVAIRREGAALLGEFGVSAGERVPFVLTYGASFRPPPPAADADRALDETAAFWTGWIEQSSYTGEWAEAVRRSLITLKALTDRRTGGIIAAPTTSLPERLGGVRNWDYRFCWLRDATLTLLALMDVGFDGEAKAWRD